MNHGQRFTSSTQIIAHLRSGTACAILVEGEERASDAWILGQLFRAVLGNGVSFYGRDGRDNLLAELDDFVKALPQDQVFAIVDRDFTDAALVTQTHAPAYMGHIFYWQRSCIENYLLEPAWITEALDEFYLHDPESLARTDLQTPTAVAAFLINTAKRLCPQIAGNWVIADLKQQTTLHNTRRYFSDLRQELTAEAILGELQKHYLGWANTHPSLFSPEALQAHLAQRLSTIETNVQALPTLHEVVSGKLLLRALYAALPPSPKPPPFEYLRNRLVRLAASQTPSEAHALVSKLLARWQTARAKFVP